MSTRLRLWKYNLLLSRTLCNISHLRLTVNQLIDLIISLDQALQCLPLFLNHIICTILECFQYGCTLLYKAVGRGNIIFAKDLIRSGADVNIKNLVRYSKCYYHVTQTNTYLFVKDSNFTPFNRFLLFDLFLIC